MSKNNLVTKSNIINALNAVGLKRGDTVIVHSSLKSFGRVEHGADTVIDALLECLGDTGTLVMPTFTWPSFHNQERIIFDLQNKSSETGLITEVFRKRKRVIRSHHITHSVAATGPNSLHIMGDGVTSFSQGSSFDVLKKLNAWNLFLGVSMEVCSALHMVEEFMPVPYRKYRHYTNSIIILPDGNRVSSNSVSFERENGIACDFTKMRNIFETAGIVHTAIAGSAEVMNIRLKDIFRIGTEMLNTDTYFFTK